MRKATFALAGILCLAAFLPAQAGDAEKGEKVFRKCKACHTAEEGAPSKVGPNLFGIVGAEAGKVDGFKYSDVFLARAAEGLVWDEDTLDAWLSDPQKFIKKAKMVLKLGKESEREDVIEYLETLKN